jgi:hypothetical protein
MAVEKAGVGVVLGTDGELHPGVHPKTETEIMVTVLDKENTCHKGKRSSVSTERN